MKYLELTNGKFSSVSDDDFYYVVSLGKFHAEQRSDGQFRAVRSVNYRKSGDKWISDNMFLHNEVWKKHNGEIPENHVVDHIDHNPLNNVISNLRLADYKQNNHNRNKTKRKCTSKYKGVSLQKNNGRWRAAICYNYKRMQIGVFDLEDDAAKAYNEQAVKYFGDRAVLNVIE